MKFMTVLWLKETRFALLLLLWAGSAVCSAPRAGEGAGSSRADSGVWRSRDGQLLPEFGRLRREGAVQDYDQCVKIAGVYESSIPAGETDVDYIKTFPVSGSFEDAVTECVRQCCELGREHCQYAWFFADKCVAIGCTEKNAEKCRPKETSLSSSIYVALQYHQNEATTARPIMSAIKDTLDSGRPILESGQPTQESGQPAQESGPTLTPGHPTLAPGHPTLAPGHLTLGRPTLPTMLMTTSPHEPRPQPTTIPRIHVQAPPPTDSPTHPPPKGIVVVSLAGESELTLPVDSTHLFSSTWPIPRHPEMVEYRWEKVGGPNKGALSGTDRKDLEMTGLVAGVYELKLTVQDKVLNKKGEATINVTVHPPHRENTPPIPVISPSSHASVTLPHNSVLFDASGSHDDLAFDTLHFHWEEVTGPVDTGVTSDSPVLQLADLQQGEYKYKLTVGDSNGLTAVAYATLTVNPEPYYPPQAYAGKDQLLLLPNDQVTLDGSKSTAFKGELQYSWEKLLGPGAVDMKGSNTPLLHLLHITSIGDYLFRLTVTDSQGQASSANVSVVVLPENNLPPEANAGPDKTVEYPNTKVLLNGSGSTDDYRIDAWEWTQLSGPTDVLLSGANSSLLEVIGLHIDEGTGSPTLYQFQLCVWDYHNLTDTTNVTVVFRKDPKTPPHVSAGGQVNITLPQNMAILNGSASYDDFGIASYQWVRSQFSPAAGLVMHHSNHQAVLILSDLVEGTYNYTLTVTSKNGMVASDEAIINVLPNPFQDYSLQVHIEGDASSFTLAEQHQLERVLSLILDDVDVDYNIMVQEVRPIGSHFRVEFYAVRRDNHAPMNATMAYMKLTQQGQDYHYPNSNFHFIKINMKVCRLPCSGHGSCDRKTNRCSCNRYWMENPIKANFGKKVTNCEWSVFYVVLGLLLSVAVVLFLIWLACCCCMRKRRTARAKRRVRYAILDRKNTEERRRMLPHDDYQQTSLMVSESETEEEILFQTKTGETGTKNGNGTVSPADVQIRTNHKLANGSAKTGAGADHSAGT